MNALPFLLQVTVPPSVINLGSLIVRPDRPIGILHSGIGDGFCLVYSDSDYTRLVTRIRKEGNFVMGIGEKKTPKAFVKACDVFVYTEYMIEEEKAVQQKRAQTSRAKRTKKEKVGPFQMPVLSQAFEMAVG
jgi:hypothetical protein